jgi:uncharacterized membrane protein
LRIIQKIPENMFEFQQYLGFLAFLTILTIGFWLMIFLITMIIPYWVIGGTRELLKERKAKKESEQ